MGIWWYPGGHLVVFRWAFDGIITINVGTFTTGSMLGVLGVVVSFEAKTSIV